MSSLFGSLLLLVLPLLLAPACIVSYGTTIFLFLLRRPPLRARALKQATGPCRAAVLPIILLEVS